MSNDPITLTLSRADAERLRLAITRMSGVNYVYDAEGEPWEMSWDAVAALDAALAAPAEGPERAATGETLVRCGRCGAPFAPHPDPARFDHDFCEACLPEAVKHWGMMQTLPERRAAGEERGA